MSKGWVGPEIMGLLNSPNSSVLLLQGNAGMCIIVNQVMRQNKMENLLGPLVPSSSTTFGSKFAAVATDRDEPNRQECSPEVTKKRREGTYWTKNRITLWGTGKVPVVGKEGKFIRINRPHPVLVVVSKRNTLCTRTFNKYVIWMFISLWVEGRHSQGGLASSSQPVKHKGTIARTSANSIHIYPLFDYTDKEIVVGSGWSFSRNITDPFLNHHPPTTTRNNTAVLKEEKEQEDDECLCQLSGHWNCSSYFVTRLKVWEWPRKAST